jgi:inositol oxygenase
MTTIVVDDEDNKVFHHAEKKKTNNGNGNGVPDDDDTIEKIKTNYVKTVNEFRVYDNINEEEGGSRTPSRVIEHYKDMRSYQTLDFYKRMEKRYDFSNGQYRCLMTIEEAFTELEHYVDASDPDLVDLPNILHLLQTAEGIRRAGHPDWFQLTGLIHDMGKIMFLWGSDQNIGQDGYTSNGKQWALGGDTFVVGCKIPSSSDSGVVFPQFNILNPDMNHPILSTKYGIYEPNCGLDELKFAWGHDEYMYRMLLANNTLLPKEGLDMIRYHSAYPFHNNNVNEKNHNNNNNNPYQHLLKEDDYERLEWVRLFNKFDLYTKDNESSVSNNNNDLRGLTDDLLPYYRELLKKYGLDGKLKW